jgi:hypothetical protein
MSWNQTSAPTSGWSGLVCSSNGTIVYAVDKTTGTCYKSTNSGSTWETTGYTFSSSGINVNVLACSSDGTRIYAAPSNNVIYYSTNSGALFQASVSPSKNFQSISCNSDGSVIFACVNSNFSKIITSKDYGITWSEFGSNGVYYSVASSSNLTTGYTSFAGIVRGIYTVPSYTSILIGSYKSVACSADGTRIYAGTLAAGAISTSANSGGSWTTTSLTTTSTSGWTSIACSSDGSTVYATDGTNVYVSNDSGTTWTTTTISGTGCNYIVCSSSGASSYLTASNSIYSYSPPTICFKEDSKILCYINNEEVYVPIQNIKKETLVKTPLHGYVAVNMIGHSKMYNPSNSLRGKHRLYKCSPSKYPEMFEELIITGCHCILIDDFVSEEQKEKCVQVNGRIYVTDGKYRVPACVDDRAEPYQEEGVYTIWHLALDHDDYYMNYGIFANGLCVETTSKFMLKEFSDFELV